MANKVEKISEAMSLILATLLDEAPKLDQGDIVSVRRTPSLDNLMIDGPKGTIHILYMGGNHKKKDLRNNAILTNRDLTIGCIAHIRYFDEGMKPEDYVEWLNDVLCGIEVENTRPEYERKIYPINDELIEQENGEWKFLVRFGVPIDFIENKFKQ